MTYVVVTITYFLLIGFLLWKNEAGTYIRHMTPHHLVCILKTIGKEVRVTVKRNALLSVEEMRSRHYKNSDAPL